MTTVVTMGTEMVAAMARHSGSHNNNNNMQAHSGDDVKHGRETAMAARQYVYGYTCMRWRRR